MTGENEDMVMRPVEGGEVMDALAKFLRFMLPGQHFVLMIAPDDGKPFAGVDIGTNMTREKMIDLMRQVADQGEEMLARATNSVN